eukprot:14514719-Alexandrium_andersonii.AAC.1
MRANTPALGGSTPHPIPHPRLRIAPHPRQGPKLGRKGLCETRTFPVRAACAARSVGLFSVSLHHSSGAHGRSTPSTD